MAHPKYPHVPNHSSTHDHHATMRRSHTEGMPEHASHEMPMQHHEHFAPSHQMHGSPAKHGGRHLEEHERAACDVPGMCVDHGPM